MYKRQPLYPDFVHIPPLLWIPIAVFFIVGMSNAVNIVDGLDGLAGLITASAFAAYGAIAHLQGQTFLVQFSFIIVGACFGFLWYNALPAQMFMGDVGSLALGAALGTVALMTGQWLLMPIIAIIPVAATRRAHKPRRPGLRPGCHLPLNPCGGRVAYECSHSHDAGAFSPLQSDAFAVVTTRIAGGCPLPSVPSALRGCGIAEGRNCPVSSSSSMNRTILPPGVSAYL